MRPSPRTLRRQSSRPCALRRPGGRDCDRRDPGGSQEPRRRAGSLGRRGPRGDRRDRRPRRTRRRRGDGPRRPPQRCCAMTRSARHDGRKRGAGRSVALRCRTPVGRDDLLVPRDHRGLARPRAIGVASGALTARPAHGRRTRVMPCETPRCRVRRRVPRVAEVWVRDAPAIAVHPLEVHLRLGGHRTARTQQVGPTGRKDDVPCQRAPGSRIPGCRWHRPRRCPRTRRPPCPRSGVRANAETSDPETP